MTGIQNNLANRLLEATQSVFGDSPITAEVQAACRQYETAVENIEDSRGIETLLLAIVGAKGQGKTWVARQLVKDETTRSQLRSGDLADDATTKLVWIGPVAPDQLDSREEIYHPCAATELVSLGQPYVLLDTPGITDANQRAAELAGAALSLAPIKLLVVARDQIRAAANLMVARQIDGSVCIPVISSVEPDELPSSSPSEQNSTSQNNAARDSAIQALADDLHALKNQLNVMAPRVQWTAPILVPDFEISGDEPAAGASFVSTLLDRFHELGLTEATLGSAREQRMQAAADTLKKTVADKISEQLPQLADAVEQLHRETTQLPARVLDSLLGSESVLETGVRMRLRANLITSTSLLWFPYRTVLSLLNLTQGAWDRVLLAMGGSVPSLFGTLSSMARNVKQGREFDADMSDGIRKRTQEQVEQRLRPLCEQFHRAVLRVRPRDDQNQRAWRESESSGMRLTGIEELQNRSQRIFTETIEQSSASWWTAQAFALIGTLVFWALMAGPIIVIYRDYFTATFSVLGGQDSQLDSFPHPPPGLLFTSLVLSTLPLFIYCMVVMTASLSRRKIRAAVQRIVQAHQETIEELRKTDVVRLQYEDQLLEQTEYLIHLKPHERSAQHR